MTVNFKPSTPSPWSRQKNNAAQPYDDDESMIPINAWKGTTPNTPSIELDNAPYASDYALVAESKNLNEPDPEQLYQSKQIWKYQYNHLGTR